MDHDTAPPAAATFVSGQTAVCVPTLSRQEAYFSVKRYGVVDSVDEYQRWMTLEEAFFLATTGHIHIETLSTQGAMWAAFTSADDSFPSRYTAYALYRSRGWIVQSGLLYGVTFVLYRMSPDIVHAEYMVYVHDTTSSCALSWQLLQMLTRLAEDVKKTVLVCEVQRASDWDASLMYMGLVCKELCFRHWPALFTEGASFAMAESHAIPKRTRS
ncbi:tRNA-intron endonuclease [Aphanomyces invadans]|uniref:tRNA-intron lyase n=1 Tax=Aphanomyces invadans TaxID=157072 RepID=A0A024TFG2_9STRA|nr:tRNA-intron endonuclease [Aphanomyces invadans]ETV92778.1 tRNA-intron endonuclease [Aphanomyces invadans]|eukprot:XP_008878548.1 tRNA-intron endonuclease [Aphanomyces invadans]